MRIPRRNDVVFFTVVLLTGITVYGVDAECDESLINGFDKEMMIRIGKQKFQCKDTDKALRITTGPISNAKELTCLRNWLADGHSIGIPGTQQITVTGCFETECDENNTTKGEGVLFNKGPPVTLNCSDNKFIVCEFINVELIIERSVILPACHPGAIWLSKGVDRDKNDIKCRNPNFELKEKMSKPRYASKLMCDKNSGWTNEKGELLRGAETQFIVKCVRRTCYEDLLNISDSAHFAPREPNDKNYVSSIFCRKEDQVL
ncbi:hypothetical protein PRIPAC_73698 [Pristionchus pacificus]|uniref:Uncharacterized protein n=1 Tax=Pristionchus pacificus TaxID=54126 RepID=A0A2A6BEG9_PRIPA|nr:hypothetical protein PRIPAC_73698 [Pristionchus pacificus]|eukprot:PDM64300.1 hypothetical protein PRIPAC_52556 [Pristionchus pacificus]